MLDYSNSNLVPTFRTFGNQLRMLDILWAAKHKLPSAGHWTHINHTPPSAQRTSKRLTLNTIHSYPPLHLSFSSFANLRTLVRKKERSILHRYLSYIISLCCSANQPKMYHSDLSCSGRDPECGHQVPHDFLEDQLISIIALGQITTMDTGMTEQFPAILIEHSSRHEERSSQGIRLPFEPILFISLLRNVAFHISACNNAATGMT